MTAIGLACLLGSVLLAWLSAPVTLTLTRDSETAAATLESRVFNLFLTRPERIAGIRSAAMVRARASSNSDTPDRLVFQTTKGPVDLGRTQQLFVASRAEIIAFLEMSGPETLTLSSLHNGREQMRFLFAQLATVVLFAMGLTLVWVVVRQRLGLD
jgi:hypothetical protein